MLSAAPGAEALYLRLRERAERSFRVGAATGTRDESSQRRHTASRRRPIS